MILKILHSRDRLLPCSEKFYKGGCGQQWLTCSIIIVRYELLLYLLHYGLNCIRKNLKRTDPIIVVLNFLFLSFILFLSISRFLNFKILLCIFLSLKIYLPHFKNIIFLFSSYIKIFLILDDHCTSQSIHHSLHFIFFNFILSLSLSLSVSLFLSICLSACLPACLWAYRWPI